MEIYISLGIAVATIIGNIIISAMANKKNMALLEYRLEQLEKKVDEHNDYAKKFGECQKDIAILKEDIKLWKSNRKIKAYW